jgi:hypothetical protein
MVYQTTEDDSELADVYSTLTEEQLKIPCANCKEFGHWARECPEPDHQEEPADDKPTAESKREDKKQSGQTGGRRQERSQRVGLSRGRRLRHLWLRVHKPLTHVRGQVVAVSGVHGDGTIAKVGNLPGFGRALVATNSKANGLALCELEKRYQVTYTATIYWCHIRPIRPSS